MAIVTFTGLCGGTAEKVSQKKNTYKITKFVELPSMTTFEVFGNLGLARSDVPRNYVLEGEITGLNHVVVRSGSEPVDVIAPVKVGKP